MFIKISQPTKQSRRSQKSQRSKVKAESANTVELKVSSMVKIED